MTSVVSQILDIDYVDLTLIPIPEGTKAKRNEDFPEMTDIVGDNYSLDKSMTTLESVYSTNDILDILEDDEAAKQLLLTKNGSFQRWLITNEGKDFIFSERGLKLLADTNYMCFAFVCPFGLTDRELADLHRFHDAHMGPDGDDTRTIMHMRYDALQEKRSYNSDKKVIGMATILADPRANIFINNPTGYEFMMKYRVPMSTVYREHFIKTTENTNNKNISRKYEFSKESAFLDLVNKMATHFILGLPNLENVSEISPMGLRFLEILGTTWYHYNPAGLKWLTESHNGLMYLNSDKFYLRTKTADHNFFIASENILKILPHITNFNVFHNQGMLCGYYARKGYTVGVHGHIPLMKFVKWLGHIATTDDDTNYDYDIGGDDNMVRNYNFVTGKNNLHLLKDDMKVWLRANMANIEATVEPYVLNDGILDNTRRYRVLDDGTFAPHDDKDEYQYYTVQEMNEIRTNDATQANDVNPERIAIYREAIKNIKAVL